MPIRNAGHAHSDALHFILNITGQPFICDTGISTYEDNSVRFFERSTAAHNTVTIDKKNQSDVYGAFKIGRRAKVFDVQEEKNIIRASHDGYKHLGITHTRQFEFSDDKVVITDLISSKKNRSALAHFHFSGEVKFKIIESVIKTKLADITFERQTTISDAETAVAMGFNKTVPASHFKITFYGKLKTIIFIR